MGDVGYQYDVLGNIRNKTGVGAYSYETTRPNAVTNAGGNSYSYDANGAIELTAGRAVNWSTFNKPVSISSTTARSEFKYGPGRARYWHKQFDLADSTKDKTTYYIGGLFEKVVENNSTQFKHYISGGGKTVAEYTVKVSGATTTTETQYLHRDNQGSVVAVSNEAGQNTAQLDFDAFGNRRLVLNSSIIADIISDLSRGYTGHEHLDKLGLIHMNGRVYDPVIGRFLSADPFVQFPKNLQSYNRYSYVLNNPMTYTDPSGFLSKKV